MLPKNRTVPALLPRCGCLALLCCVLFSYACDDESTDDDTADDDVADDDSGVGDDDSAGPLWTAGDLVRIAPAVGNTVGLYDLAVCPSGDEVFFTNLHYPGIGVASATDGSLSDVIDIREWTDDTVPLFPFVVCLPGAGTLVVNHRTKGQLIRIDAASHQVLGTVTVCDHPGWMEVDEATGDLLLACVIAGAIERRDATDLSLVETFDLGETRPTRFLPTATVLVTVEEFDEQLTVFDRASSSEVDSLTVDGRPNQAAIWDDDHIFLSVRETGQVLDLSGPQPLTLEGELAAGSDTFGVTAVPQRGRVYAVARQGEDVPEGGTYTGDPGVVYAIDPDLGEVAASVEVGKTPHFAVYHSGSDRLFVGAEDSLDIAAIGADDGLEWLSGPLGLTLDDLAVDPVTGRMWFPSHLSDELWVHDPVDGARALSAPRWPFAVEMDVDARRVYAAAQQLTLLYEFDADTLELIREIDLGFGSHQLPCDPLCTGHFAGVDLALDPAAGIAYVAHPPAASVLRVDLTSGDVVEVDTGPVVDPGEEDFFQHMALAVDEASGRLFAYYGLDDRLVAIDGEEVVAGAEVDSLASRSLALDRTRSRVLLGPRVMDQDLETVDEIEQGYALLAHLAGPDLYLASVDDELHALDPLTLQVVHSMDVSDLQTALFMAGEYNLSPLLVYPLPGGTLALVLNVFEGEVEVVDPAAWPGARSHR